ncbi:IgGFc-binding protein-like [Amphiura filiformis]|uniref:IgGFc-binding protein-like n=1 Tax=Amphiura filiformis TaxID=82378 RepID=UPI003B21167B
MDLVRHFTILSVFLTIFITESFGQLSNQKEYQFVFGIPHASNPWTVPHVLITTSSTDSIETTLSIPGFGFESVNLVTRSTPVDVSLPDNIRMDADDGKQRKTIIVTASNAVSVYAFDNEINSGDGFLVIPSSQLGTQYYAASASYKYEDSHNSFICLSSLTDDTSVFIKIKNGQEHNLILHKYESYRFDSLTDLSATFIESSKPVAVVSGGHPAGSIPNGEAIFEQLPPVHNWGNQFLLTPFLSIQTGYLYRVFAAKNSTRLNINGNSSMQLDAGEYYEGDISGDIIVSLTSNLPVMVIEIMRDYYDNFRRGDYADLLIPPVKYYTNNITFPVFNYNYGRHEDYYINVVIDCSMINGLLYDGNVSMVGWDQLTGEDGSMCVVRGKVTTGVHSVSHSDESARFAVSVYGICDCGSAYAYPGGITYSTDTSRGNRELMKLTLLYNMICTLIILPCITVGF